MAVPPEIKALVPSELQDIARGYYNKNQDTYFFYRLDSVQYDKEKGRGVDKRTPLGSVKNGKWKYSPSYLKLLEITKLQAKVQQATQPEQQTAPAESQAAVPDYTVAVQETKTYAARPHRSNTCSLRHAAALILLSSLAGYTSASGIAAYGRHFAASLSFLFSNFTDNDLSQHNLSRVMQMMEPLWYEDFCRYFAGQALVSDGKIISTEQQAQKQERTTESAGRYSFRLYDSEGELLLTHEAADKRREAVTAIEVLSHLNLRQGFAVAADLFPAAGKLIEFMNLRKVTWCFALKDSTAPLCQQVISLFRQHPENIKTSGNAGSNQRPYTVEILPGNLLPEDIMQALPGLADGSLLKASPIKEQATGYFIAGMNYAGHSQEEASLLTEAVCRHLSAESEEQAYDVVFSPGCIQNQEAVYLQNRLKTGKIAGAILSIMQRRIKELTGKNLTAAQLRDLCATPEDALEMLTRYATPADILPYGN